MYNKRKPKLNFDLLQPKGACGRVDLLHALALAEGNRQRELALAEVLEFYPKPDKENDIKPWTGGEEESETNLPKTETTQTSITFKPYRLVSLDNIISNEAWQAGQSGQFNGDTTDSLTAADNRSWKQQSKIPDPMPIAPWTRLWPHLRQAVAQSNPAMLDLPRLTTQLARGIAVRRLPRTRRLNWPNRLPVIFDFSDRLTPYWDDWHWFMQRLQAHFKKQVQCYRLAGVPQKPLQAIDAQGKPVPEWLKWPKIGTGDTILIVSDLGLVDPVHPMPTHYWRDKLADYRRRGVKVTVLAPVSIRHLQPALVNLSAFIRFNQDSTLRPLARMSPYAEILTDCEPKLSSAAKNLLTMMSVASKVEPALLRELRCCLPDSGSDCGVEGEVWCWQELDTSATACALSAWAVLGWRDGFSALPESLQQRTLASLRLWHSALPQAIHHEETLLWRTLARAPLARTEEDSANQARNFFIKLKNTLLAEDSESAQSGSRQLQVQLADHHLHWTATTLKQEPYLLELLRAVDNIEPERLNRGLPQGIDPVAWCQNLPMFTPQRLDLVAGPDLALRLLPAPYPAQTGTTRLATFDLDRASLLWAWHDSYRLESYRPWQWQEQSKKQSPALSTLLHMQTESSPPVNLYLHSGRQRWCVEEFTPPAWASDWGQDGFGLFADLDVQGAIQRFRWIAPGSFLMGSPESEEARDAYETQHEVTLTQGYWLADSTCTQVLWIAVMGVNSKSRFTENANNPVENISWDDVQAFIRELNWKVPDLESRLPSEAEWEYACRAGTTTPFSWGDNITPEQVNYDGEYPYAYGEKGLYRRQTVAVRSLPPNPWGLYEMHGNVWEWCQDRYDDYSTQAVSDPRGTATGAGRVLRGGSWDGSGRDARSAYRLYYGPASRYLDFGFRLALGRCDWHDSQLAGGSPAFAL